MRSSQSRGFSPYSWKTEKYYQKTVFPDKPYLTVSSILIYLVYDEYEKAVFEFLNKKCKLMVLEI